MPIHAFIDESRRGDQYLMAVALVTPRQLTPLRQRMHQLLLPGERELHFAKEQEPRKRRVTACIARLPIEVIIYAGTCARGDEPVRQACLTTLTENLVVAEAQLMVLDSRNNWQGNDRDRHDRSTLQRVLGKSRHSSNLVFQHVDSKFESLLWIADVAAWCWGAGGEWRRQIRPIVREVIPIGPQTARNPAAHRPERRPGPLRKPRGPRST